MMRRPPPPAGRWDSDPETPPYIPWSPRTKAIVRVVVLLGVLAVLALWVAACASANLNGLIS